MNPLRVYTLVSSAVTGIGDRFQSVLLLALRLWWGWSFFLTGRGKLLHLDQTAEFFASLHIPQPRLNAMAAGSVECVGGLLLMAGLASRLSTVPLMTTLAVAYATAEREALFSIVSDPDKFTAATPFLFLLAVVVVFAFGPGAFSLDALIEKRGRFGRARTSAPQVAVANLVDTGGH